MNDDTEHFVEHDFWQYLLEHARDNDVWWLASWLKSGFEEYANTTPCPRCESRRHTRVDVWSRTRNHILEHHDTCRVCGYVFDVSDHRPYLRAMLEEGKFSVRDTPILSEELNDS
jgi:rubredoxin